MFLPCRRPTVMRFLAPLALFCSLLGGSLIAADSPASASADHEVAPSDSRLVWSAFRGTDGSGRVDSGEIPSIWSDSDYRWRRKLGSRDVGSPVIAAGKAFLLVSKPSTQEIALEAVDLVSGQLLWSRAYPQQPHPLHARNTLASSTPACDETHVVVAWSEPQHTYLKCFDHQGNEVWSRDFGSWKSQHGFGTSPRIVGDIVLLLNSQQALQLPPGETPGESRLIAVDRQTGEDVWKSPLTATNSCYGVPAVYRHPSGTTQIIAANTGNGLFGLDIETGKMLWNQKVFDKRCVSTPVVVGNVAIGTSGSGGGGNRLVGVQIPDQLEGEAKEVYTIDRFAPYVPSPAVKDGRLFLVADTGIASCVDAKSGEVLWSQRIGGNFGASPVIIGDKLLLISLDGVATILSAEASFRKLGEVDLYGAVGASPAYAEGSLLLRVDDELRCLGGDAT